ncbi:MAG: serine hydrolase domain-containing protein [Mangrovibacterium sp.]
MKHLNVRLIALGAFCLVLTLSACSKKSKRDPRVVLDKEYKEEILKARDLLRVNVVSSFTGFSACASIDDKVVWSEGIGYSNTELSVLVKPEHKFRIGASSRLFSSLILLRLHERGVIDMNKPYNEYVADNPNWNFTPLQLATNSAGLPDVTEQLYREATVNNYRTTSAVLAAHKSDELLFSPDEYFAESALGTLVLTDLLEKVSGKKYKDLLKEEVLIPFGLTDTDVDFSGYVIKKRASQYSRNSIAQIRLAPEGNISAVAPALGVLSSADDLNRLGRAFLKKEVLTEESYKQLLSNHVIPGKGDSPWGMGIEVMEDVQGRKLLLLRGQIEGGASMLLISPELGLVVSFCGNLSEDYTTYPFMEVVALFMKRAEEK